MNTPRGPIRLWVVLSLLFVTGASTALYTAIRKEFSAAGPPLDFYDEIAKNSGG